MATLVLAVDPGPTESAWALISEPWNRPTILQHAKEPTGSLLAKLRNRAWSDSPHVLVLEQIQSYGKVAGRTLFDTAYVTGRLAEAYDQHYVGEVVLMPRRDVKLRLVGRANSGDTDVRRALLDIYGSPGTKTAPGALYGIRRDEWSALALGWAYAHELRSRLVNVLAL
jgi:hypothetical protein